MDSDEEVFLSAIRAGLVGFVLKDASAVKVASAIREDAAGRAVCPPALYMVLFRLIIQQSREQEMVELLR
jgi:DNA-binding NarL/FixJ family response regulator